MRKGILFFALLCFLSACGDDGSPTGPAALSTARVLAIAAPDTLYSGSRPLQFTATVEDSINGMENVAAVVVRLTRSDSVWFSADLELQNTTAAGGGQFGAVFDSTFAAGRLGDYSLEFSAVDRAGNNSNVLAKNIYLENEPPLLFFPVVADSVQAGSLDFRVQVSGRDPQGPDDIAGVFFQNRKPDGTFGGQDQYYPLFDVGQGLAGDAVGGDGIYSWDCLEFKNESGQINCPPADAILGTYTLVFRARDRAGNQSATITRDYELVEPQR